MGVEEYTVGDRVLLFNKAIEKGQNVGVGMRLE
jgi:hypothetical protein